MQARWLWVSVLLCTACARQAHETNTSAQADPSVSGSQEQTLPTQDRTWEEVIAASDAMEPMVKEILVEYGFLHAEHLSGHNEASSYWMVYTVPSLSSDQIKQIKERLLQVSDVYRLEEERDGALSITCDPPYLTPKPEHEIIASITLYPDGRGRFTEDETGPRFVAISIFRTLWRKEWDADESSTGG